MSALMDALHHLALRQSPALASILFDRSRKVVVKALTICMHRPESGSEAGENVKITVVPKCYSHITDPGSRCRLLKTSNDQLLRWVS
jgi:hypothetical protein